MKQLELPFVQPLKNILMQRLWFLFMKSDV